MRVWILPLLLAALLLAVAACGDDDEPTASPSGSASASLTGTPTSSPSSSPTQTVTSPLTEVLSDPAEVPPTRALTDQSLLFAYKEGKHVRVLLRNVTTGQEQFILEYDEPNEAKHDNNYWDELIPSVALDPAGRFIVYASDPDLIRYDLATGVTKTLLSRAPGDTEEMTHRWVTQTGRELCCAYTLAAPSIGPGGRIVFLLTQYEGSTIGSLSADASDVCEVSKSDGRYFFFGINPSWNSAGDLATGDWGDSTTGLFVTRGSAPCLAVSLDSAIGYQDAVWSPDGKSVAAIQRTAYGNEPLLPLVSFSADGSGRVTLVPDGWNYSPLFAQDGQSVYYERNQAPPYPPTDANNSVWVHDLQPGASSEVVSLPKGWFGEPVGWTVEGYMIVRLTSGCDFYLSCGSRIALIDPADGSLVYLSAQRDFTNYLGFLP
jgi:hypothetical protein